MKKVLVKVSSVAFVSLLLLSCGKGGSGSDTISDDGLFGSIGAEFVEIFLNEPNRDEISDAIAKEVEGEMMRKYPDYEDMNFRARPEIQIELNQRYEEAKKKYDYQGLKDKWDQRIAELVEELMTIEVPIKVEEGTPFKLVSPYKLKKIDIQEYKTDVVMSCKVELTDDVIMKVEKWPYFYYMDADGNQQSNHIAEAPELKLMTEGLKKGSQIELEDKFVLDKKSISHFFSAKDVMLTWNTYYVEDGKLGPVQIGMSYTDLPKSVPGLYEKFDYKKEMIENELDGDYLSETCTFIKNGKEYFRADLVDGKVTSIILDENSSGLCTKEGYTPNITGLYGFYYVTEHSSYGMFSSKAIRESLDWENYYEGEVFATIDRYTFYVPSESAKIEFPRKYEDFKDNARISKIVCK